MIKELIKLFLTLFNFILNKIMKKKEEDLKLHPVFSKINYYQKILIPKLKIKNRYKREMAIKFLQIKFEVLKNMLLILCDPKFCIEGNDVKNLVISHVNEYYEKSARAGVLKEFLEKFAEIHEPYTQFSLVCITDILASKLYHTDYNKKTALLSVAWFSFDRTVLDIEKTLNKMNGDLNKAIKKAQEGS